MTDRLTCRRCEEIVSKTETTCYEKWGHSREWVAEHIDTYICRDCLFEVASQRASFEGSGDGGNDNSTENSAIDNWV